MLDPTEIRIWAIFALMFAAMCYFVFLKWKYTRDAKGHVLAAIRNKAGRWRFELMAIVDGLIELPARGAGEAGKTYAVDSESAPDVAYPINKWSFVQTTIPMVVLNEENWEPLSNVSGRPVLPPKLLYVMRHEGWSAHGIRLAHEVDAREGDGRKAPRKSWSMSTWVWIVIVLVLVGALIWGYNEIQSLRAAAGV